jgi:hypothetical protein
VAVRLSEQNGGRSGEMRGGGGGGERGASV